jgi:hypothetical protein
MAADSSCLASLLVGYMPTSIRPPRASPYGRLNAHNWPTYSDLGPEKTLDNKIIFHFLDRGHGPSVHLAKPKLDSASQWGLANADGHGAAELKMSIGDREPQQFFGFSVPPERGCLFRRSGRLFQDSSHFT